MSNIYNPRYTRGGYGKYNKNKSFISMEAGTDAFYLEDEANESQWIQNELRADLVRREFYSGVYQKCDNDVISSAKIFNTNDKIYNSFLVKPMIINVNGYFIDVLGANGFNNQAQIPGTFEDVLIKKLNYIKLPEPPEDGDFYDFVFLEMCFAELKFNDDIWYSGSMNHSYGLIDNDLFDRRINGETNRRIQLKWNIGVSRVPMDYVIANEELLKDKKIFALFDESINAQYTPAKGAYHKNSTLGFWNATTGLDQKTDSDDIGLWIAGVGLDKSGNSKLHTTDGYSYAIPLFKVIRRNTQSYYSANLLGSSFAMNDSNSMTNRPDGKFANIIYEDDVIDLRNFIRIDNISKVLHENFENLLLNKTKFETKLFSTYFGVDAIIPDEDTILYEGCNQKTFDTTLLQNKRNWNFIPGVEQEAVQLGEGTYLAKDLLVYNANLKGVTSQFFVKIPPEAKQVGLYTLFDTVSGARLIAYVKDAKLFVAIDSDLIVYDFNKHVNKFTHVAIAVRDTDFTLIINNKIVSHKNLSTWFNIDDQFTVKFGLADVVEYFAENCIFDEIEVSNIYEDQFNRIPQAIGNDNADVSIDTQLGRKNYTLIKHVDSHTFHRTFKTDEEGKLFFALSLPLTLEFTNDVPTVYFDNEAIQVSTEVQIRWSKENNKWYCTITGLGQGVTYNLVIITTVIFAANQGLPSLPKLAHAAYAEKSNKTFYAVADSMEKQEHNIGYSAAKQTFTNKNKFIALNPIVSQFGFCTYVKCFMNVDGKRLTLNKKTYADVIGIHSILYKGENVLHDFYLVTHDVNDSNGDVYVVNLTKDVQGEVELHLITSENCCLYSLTKSGILNLYQMEEINDFGNGTRTTFTHRSNTKIISLMQSKFDKNMYHYAYVNGHPERINIMIDGTFIHYSFENPPINKADIKTYIITEYDPLRSERLEFVYEIDRNLKTISDVASLDQLDIVHHENEIFVTTDGYGIYPYQKNQSVSHPEIKLSDAAIPLNELSIKLNPNPADNHIIVTLNNDSNAPVDYNPYESLRITGNSVDNTSARYSTLRVITDEDQLHNNLEVHGSAVNTSVVKSSAGVTYNCNADAEEIPLFTFRAVDEQTHSLADDNVDVYTYYMLNKTMPTLDNLPAIEFLTFKLSPVDILSSNKCNILFNSNNEAHIIVKDPLPISTNLSAAINYCVPNFSGTFLTTFNKLHTADAIPVAKGYRNCSIDNKSFYSLTTLNGKIAHINVFPFLIKDYKSKILKLGIFAQFNTDDKICIEAAYAAMDIYPLNKKYLIRHI